MNKIILTLSFVLGLAVFTNANNADLFSIDEAAIEAEFEEIGSLESYVQSNEGITFNEMEVKGELNNFNLDFEHFDASAAPMFGIEDVDWSSFACGFCCWPVGIFTVLLNDNKDADSKTSYFVGLGTNIVLGLVSAATGALNGLATP